MRRLFTILCLLPFFVTPAFAQNPVRQFYISSSTGDDSNPGTRNKPRRTVSSVIREQHDHIEIRLKCGDVFYENIRGLSNATIRSYGSGEKPVLCGFKVLDNLQAWTYVGENIWRIDLKNSQDFTGFPETLSSNKETFNDVGCIYDSHRDKIWGHMVRTEDDLALQGDFFLTRDYQIEKLNADTFRYLLLYSERDPSEFGRLGFSVSEHGVSSMRNCIIRDIAIIGFAKHGMCSLDNCLVDNCTLDIIGGSLQVGFRFWVRYGNGIEFWISDTSPKHNWVRNCTISRTYDCGATIQGNGGTIVNAEDLHFVNNRFYHCRQAFEHFLLPTDKNSDPQYIDCDFTGNICFEMGENEFGSSEERDCNILSYEETTKPISIKRNVFYGASHYFGSRFADGMELNTIYVFEGQYLNVCKVGRVLPTIFSEEESSLDSYFERTGDSSRIILLKKGSARDKRICRRVARQVGWRRPNLLF